MWVVILQQLKFVVDDMVLLLMPAWYQNTSVDAYHFSHRRRTKRYKARMQTVKKIWVVTSISILIIPSPPFAVATSLFVVFLSFSILDDSK